MWLLLTCLVMAINPEHLRAIMAGANAPGNGVMRVPSEAERAEARRVLELQVRAQAASLATQLLAQRQTSLAVWDKWVGHIQFYILEGDNAGVPPVRTGPPS